MSSKREIKFRAFDKQTNKMSPEFVLFGEFILMGAVHDWQHHFGNKSESSLEALGDLEIMQYTGLKDKNGKEIYEGDIVKVRSDEKVMTISWSEKFASFVIYREGWAFQHWFGEAMNPEDCEIIGNIYENPELLK